MEAQDKYFNLKSLSDYADIPVSTLRDYMKGEGLPHYKLKGKVLVRRSEFNSWMQGFQVDTASRLDDIASEAIKGLKSDNQSAGQRS